MGKLKQRIVGALVVVALAIIFLPKFFNNEPEDHNVKVEAPAMPQPSQESQPSINTPLVPSPQPQSQPESEAQANQPEPVAEPQPQPQQLQAAAPAPSRPAAAKVPAQSSSNHKVAKANSGHLDGAGLPQSWSIQLAALGNEANANAMVKKLRGEGYKAYTRKAGKLNRVLVGPMIDKAKAEQLVKKLNAEYRLQGRVVLFTP